MKVAVSTRGTFHSFDLARELHSRGLLSMIFTGYPRFKLRGARLPQELIQTFPYLHAPYMAFPWWNKLPPSIARQWEHWVGSTFDRHVARHFPECDVFVGLSGSALMSGREAHRRGVQYVCDRGSSHIRTQDQLLREEHELWGLPFDGIDPRVIEGEEAEYAEADAITVPSSFVLRSFIEQGVPMSKLRLLPYGVNLATFAQVADPDPNSFDVLFVGGMSLRKGIPYLLQAYSQVQHPRKTLSFVGARSSELICSMQQRGLWPADARVLGHVPQDKLKPLMSRSHVMVLPSVEEGLALVQAQAMACGCPVIGTTHTGAEDLFSDGEEGFIVPARDVDAMASQLQRLADTPELRAAMSARAKQRTSALGGWGSYGRKAVNAYQPLRSASVAKQNPGAAKTAPEPSNLARCEDG